MAENRGLEKMQLTEQERKEKVRYHLDELKKLRATPRSGANRPVDVCFERTGA